MAEYEASKVLDAPPEQVWAVVADVGRLAAWLPTMTVAEPAGTDQVHVEGEAHGHHYASEGFFRAEDDQRRVEWGSESRGGEMADYAGWLQVADSGAGGSEVTVHLSFFDEAQDLHTGDPDREIDHGIAVALDRLADQLG